VVSVEQLAMKPAGDVARGPADAEGVSLFVCEHVLEAGITAESLSDIGVQAEATLDLRKVQSRAL
jgi:hypothetical protein